MPHGPPFHLPIEILPATAMQDVVEQILCSEGHSNPSTEPPCFSQLDGHWLHQEVSGKNNTQLVIETCKSNRTLTVLTFAYSETRNNKGNTRKW